MAPFRKRFIVSYDDEGHTLLIIDIHKLPEECLAGGRIKVARRLVGEDDTGLKQQCPRNSDTLLFTARQFAGLVITPLAIRPGLRAGGLPCP